jgi:hypothetical protein
MGSNNPPRDETDKPLQGKEALQLYLSQIASNVDELGRQAKLLEQIFADMEQLRNGPAVQDKP